MPTFEESMTPEPEASVRTRIIGFALGAGLKITNWIIGGTGQQMFETVVSTAQFYTTIVANAIRGYGSLDTSYDPGDDDPIDPTNVQAPPSAGYLSNKGLNDYATPRINSSFASGSVTFVNNGTVARSIAPGGIILTWAAPPDGKGPRTYRNVADSNIYSNPDGTRTVNANTSIELPVQCTVIGSFGSAPTNALSMVTTLLGCSATNAAAIIGLDRQERSQYIAECRKASARLSLNGPSSALEYLANHNIDGTPLMNAAVPPAIVGITRTYVTEESSTGNVQAWFASAGGAAIADDVTAANKNIEEQSMAVANTRTYTGGAAGEMLLHIAGSVKIAYRPGLDQTKMKTAIVNALISAWPLWPISGLDVTAGFGSIYDVDLECIVRDSYPGFYFPSVTGGSNAIPVGSVATLQTATSDWTITVVGP